MSYAIVLEPDARAALAALPAPVADRVRGELQTLAASPSAQPTRSSNIPMPAGQLYQATFTAGGVTCMLDVVFRYGQDEQTLFIVGLFVEYD